MGKIRKIHPHQPIFRVKAASREAVYTPGHLAVFNSCDADAIEYAWGSGRDPEGSIAEAARELQIRAREASERDRERVDAPFAPECLAVSLSRTCNLNCTYCYSAGAALAGTARAPELEDIAIPAAARLVAANCAASGRPFHLVLQGDGEPSLHWDTLQKIVGVTREIADLCGAGWFGYISTNGVLSERRALWLARNFSRVSLSCDGPPDIQDSQRPFPDGSGSSGAVARTARTMLAVQGRLDVRATITPQTVARQCEIACYLRESLGATHIRFEPIYRPSSDLCSVFCPGDAELFAAHFLEAQQAARAKGADLAFSGVRLAEIHGPYCDVLRQTLRLGADGVANACFRYATAGVEIGRTDSRTGRFVLDTERIQTLREAGGRIPPACRECVNVYHCARACPDECLAGGISAGPNGDAGSGPGFRCLLHQRLAAAWLVSLLDEIP